VGVDAGGEATGAAVVDVEVCVDVLDAEVCEAGAVVVDADVCVEAGAGVVAVVVCVAATGAVVDAGAVLDAGAEAVDVDAVVDAAVEFELLEPAASLHAASMVSTTRAIAKDIVLTSIKAYPCPRTTRPIFVVTLEPHKMSLCCDDLVEKS
jgi:hypothetical protein